MKKIGCLMILVCLFFGCSYARILEQIDIGDKRYVFTETKSKSLLGPEVNMVNIFESNKLNENTKLVYSAFGTTNGTISSLSGKVSSVPTVVP